MLVTGAYGAGSVMLKVDKKGDTYAASELFKNPDFGATPNRPFSTTGTSIRITRSTSAATALWRWT